MTKTVATFAALMMAASGCGAEDPGEPAETEEVAADDDGDMPGWPGENDSSHKDGSSWPKWKNPCPGPACDPPHDRRDEVSNPQPHEAHAPLSDQASVAPGDR